MEENKSIDGLRTHDAKKTSKKPSTRKVISVKPVKKSTPKPAAIIPEESIEIQVVEDVAAKIESDTDKAKQTHEEAVEDFLNPVQAFNLDDEPEDDSEDEPDDSDTEPEESDKPEEPSSAEVDDTPDSESSDDLLELNTAVEKKPKKTAKKAEKKASAKPHKVRRIVTTTLLVIVLATIGLILWAVLWGNDIIAKITGGKGNVFDLLALTSETYDPLKTDSNGRTNILAFGTSGYNMDGDEGDGTHAGAQLTDSIMMISLNQETGDIAMLSLPRDLKASPTCTATGKINEVYWCNGGGGSDTSIEQEAEAAYALMSEVGSILGVDFQYFAHLNWGSLVNIVDTLDGITITLDEDIEDYYWTGAVFQAGIPYTINGEQALGLARARHGTMGGDFSRGASQQKILIGIKDRVIEKNLSLTDILSLASTLGDNLRTNFSISELKTMAHLAFEFDLDTIRQISLYDPMNNIYYMTTGTLDNGISYVFPRAGVGNYGAIQEYVATNLSNDPRVYEQPTIAILNASEVAGLAGSEKTKLEEQGYTVSYIDNAPEGEYETGTFLYMVGNKPGTRDLLTQLYQFKSIDELPESITRDYDFVIILNPEATE